MSRFGSHDLSDEEILQIGMHYGDPRAGFDLLLTEAVPETIEWVKLVAKYKCRDAVKCMRPGCGQPHNEGAVVEIKMIDQTTGLLNIGHDCGEQLFPEEYLAGGTRYDTDLERKRMIIKKRLILSKEREIKKWFEIFREPFEDYDNARREFEAFFPDLLDEIRNAFRSRDGELVVQASPGKVFREALAAEGIKTRIDSGWSVAHRVTGRHFFSKGELVERSAKAATECGKLIDRLRPDNLSVLEMRECLSRLGKIGERMDKMVWQHRDMFTALTPENLRGIAKWSSQTDQYSPYEFKNNGLFRHADGGLPEHFLKPVAEAEPPKIEAFPISRAA